MRRLRGDVVMAVVLLTLALVLLAETVRFDAASRLVPLSVLVPLVPLLAWCLARAVATSRRSAESTPAATERRRSGDAWLIGWVLALPLLANLAGAVVGPALFVAAWLRFRGRESLPVAVIGFGATAVTLLLLMAALLGTMPALAVLPEWLAR